jgi:clan AA aspartic protease (TIGR02281 family)
MTARAFRVKARRLLALSAVLLACTGGGWVDLDEAGKAAYARGDYARAERLFRQALAAAPDEPQPHYHHGVALTHLHRWTEAASAFEKALALRPPVPLAAAARQGLRSVEPMTRPRASEPAPAAEVARPSPPRPRRVQLPPDTVEVRRRGGNWFVDVTLNDLQQAAFLVDTGASACAITPELAEAIGIVPDPDEPPVLVRGVTGSTWGRRVTIPSIRVGETESHDVIAFVIPLPGMQGILGNTFLSRFTATLDPGRARLTLQPR